MDNTVDMARRYINRLATGYRYEQGTIVAPGAVLHLIVPDNPNRVLLILTSDSANSMEFWFRPPSGEHIPWVSTSDNNAILVTVKDHLMLPTFEWFAGSPTVGPIQFFEVIKL